MDREQTKQAIEGFTQFFKAITGNQDLKIPDEIAEKYGIETMNSVEPRQVLYTGDGYADGEMVYDMANCPKCGRDFEDGDETWNCNFCPDCGQALKWEEE